VLHWQVARRSFGRFSTYRGATAAGVFTNTVFGVLRAYILLAVFDHREAVGGFDAVDTVTYTFLTQGLLVTVGVFGSMDLPDRIRTGDVVSDLYRPVDFQAYWGAQEAGRAAFQALGRGIPPFVLGSLLFTLRLPADATTAAAFLASLVGAVAVSFGYRYLVSLTGFWLLDTRGATQLFGVVLMFFSGFIVPLTFLPPGLAEAARALPFAAMVQLPVEIFLGKHQGLAMVGVLATQAFWAVVLLAAGRVVTGRAVRKVVVQGG
jgi:ABC-2 type transport system permease protein